MCVTNPQIWTLDRLQPHLSRLSAPKAICVSGPHQLLSLISGLPVRAQTACLPSKQPSVAYWQKDGNGWKKKLVLHVHQRANSCTELLMCVLNGSILSGSLALGLQTRRVCTEAWISQTFSIISGFPPWSLLNLSDQFWGNKRTPNRVFPHILISRCVALKTSFSFSKYKPLKCNHMVL